MSPPTLSPELVSRFKTLIEDITDELMHGRELDRSICRADAIALLVDASEQFENSERSTESPLRYMLMQERQKAAAYLCEAHEQPLYTMRA